MEVAARTVTVVPAITGLVDRLEQAGLIVRQRSETDRRVVLVTTTEKALGILKELDVPLVKLHQSLLGHMTADELRQLSRLLEKARAEVPEEAPS